MLRYLILDLDNTLYPASTGMEDEVVRRMSVYAGAYLGVSPAEALAMRRELPAKYGTTLEWLMAEKGFDDPEAFFAAVHPEGEEDCLEPSPELGAMLDSIALPKAVFTNAPREHADRVLARLGVADRFEAVYDIRFSGLRGKPRAEAFAAVAASCGVSPTEAFFVDDLPRYVEGFASIGGRGAVVDELDHHVGTRFPRIHSLFELPGLLEELGEI